MSSCLNLKTNALKKILSENDLKVLQEGIEKFKTDKKSTKWNDNAFSPGFSAETGKYCHENLNLSGGNVLVASYPKTGTTWTAEIIQRIICEDEREYEIASDLPHPITYLEIAPSSKFAILEKIPVKRQVALTHMQADLVNVEKYTKSNVKIVYVLRNPKDQMVSYYKFLQDIPSGRVEPLLSMRNKGWNRFFEHVVQGDFPWTMKPGQWYPDHILTWYKHKDNKNVYFIYYEDMIKDFEGQIKLLATFLNAPVTDEKAKMIAEACSFNNMKKSHSGGETFKAFFMNINLRKGGVGGWKDYFTVSQSEKIDAMMEDKMSHTDIKFTYELKPNTI